MDPRAIWSGAIQFGLVNIPVKLFVATMRKNVSFRSLHPKCGKPLKRPYFCPTDEEQVPFKEVVKGYAYTKDKYVVLTDEDFVHHMSIQDLFFVHHRILLVKSLSDLHHLE